MRDTMDESFALAPRRHSGSSSFVAGTSAPSRSFAMGAPVPSSSFVVGASAPFSQAAGLALACCAILLLILGYAQTRSTIVLEVDGAPGRLYTRVATVGAALQQAGLHLHPEDRVSPALDAPLQAGLTIHVQRARPVVLEADGQSHRLRTHATTITELLTEAGLPLGPGDKLRLDGSPADLQSPLQGALPVISLDRALNLTLDDGGAQTTLHSTASTVGQVLRELDLALFAADRISPAPHERIREGMVILLERSVPVQIRVDGHTIRTRTLAHNVAAVLGQEGIALVGKDTVEPDLQAAVRSGMTIQVTRVQEEYVLEFDPIPFETIWVSDPELEIDHTRLAQEGQPGLTKVRFRVRYEDGVEVERVLEDVWAAQEPITKTLAYGTKIIVRTLETPDGPIEYWRKMRVYTTSYTAASAGRPADHPRFGYTRLGWYLTKGIVAVDPEVIPLRTNLYVPGYGLARAGDTGGGVKGKFVDLGFDPWNYESWHWWTDVYLLTPVPPASQIRWILPDWPKYPDRRR